MYNMWSGELLFYLKLTQYPVNPLDYFTYEELNDIILQALDETVTQYAWKLMLTRNISLQEAKICVVAAILESDDLCKK